MCTLCALDFCGAGLCKCSVCASVSPHVTATPLPIPKQVFRLLGLNRRNIDAYYVLPEQDLLLFFSKKIVIVFRSVSSAGHFHVFYLPLSDTLARSWLSKALTFKCLPYEPSVIKHQTMLACRSHTCDPPLPLLYIVHGYCQFMCD